MARQQILKSAWDEGAHVVTYTIKDRPDLAPVVVYVAALPDDIKICSMLHGIDQKFRDAVAGKAKDLGGDVTKFYALFAATARDMATQLGEGNWNSRAEGGGTPGGGLYVRAYAVVFNRPLEVVKAAWAKLTSEQKTGIRKDTRISAWVRAEQDRLAAARPRVETLGVEDLIPA